MRERHALIAFGFRPGLRVTLSQGVRTVSATVSAVTPVKATAIAPLANLPTGKITVQVKNPDGTGDQRDDLLSL